MKIGLILKKKKKNKKWDNKEKFSMENVLVHLFQFCKTTNSISMTDFM